MTPGEIRAAVIAVIAALLLAAGFAGGWAINGWRLSGDLERARGELARERDANKDFRATIEDQTKAVLGWKAASDARIAKAEQAIEEARKQAAALDAKAAALLKRPVPFNPAEDCPTLERELNEAIRGRKAL